MQIIAGSLKHADLQEDQLVAVTFELDWYHGQFISYVETAKVNLIHFLKRSSSNQYWFVWPELSPEEKPDESYMYEGKDEVIMYAVFVLACPKWMNVS